MKIEKIKLIYHDKYQHYYYPLRIDQETQTVQMMLKTGKKERTIHKDAIVHTNDLPGWTFIIMRNKYITAEDNFLRAMAAEGEYHRKMKELSDFKRNGLPDSEVAMNELIRLYQSGYNDVRSKEDYTFRKAVQRLYNSLCCPSKDERRRTYDQHIPGDIRDLAAVKGLFIERVDEFYYDKDGRQRRANNQMRQAIRKEHDCGYLIRNGRGEVLIGGSYQLTDEAVCEFVRNYQSKPEDRGNYKVPLTQAEEKKYRICRKILMRNHLRWSSKNNLKFWVKDQQNQVLLDGVGIKKLYRWCLGLEKSDRSNYFQSHSEQ